MRSLFIAGGCLALCLAVTPRADAQGPIRQGLRRTGEIAAQGTRRIVGGAADVTRGVVGGAADVTRGVVGTAADATRGVVGTAADATRGVVGGAADVTRGVVGGAARGVAAGVDALTPGVPIQARAGANLQAAEQGREARWRFQQHNGEWWYYTPQNSWMYYRDGNWNQFSQDSFQQNPAFSGRYSSAYRGMEGAPQASGQYAGGYQRQSAGQSQRLYRDHYGREYVCENGRRVYVNSQQAQPYSAGFGGVEGQQYQGQQQGGMTPTPAIPTEPGVQGAQQTQGFQQGQTGATGQSSLQGQAGSQASPSSGSAIPQTGTSATGTGGVIQSGETAR